LLGVTLKTEKLIEHCEETETESDEIDDIIAEVDEQEAITEDFISDTVGFREKRVRFDKEVIRVEVPVPLKTNDCCVLR
jgi:hypothetical protein